MSAIKRVSLSEQVLSSIIKNVQERGLQVGDQLPTEGEFAELFQVSRTSVREAMKALSMNGAVESIPGKGTFMRTPMLNFILNESENLVFQANVSISQLMEIRTALELLAGDLAITRATEEEVETVALELEHLKKAVLSGKPWVVEGTSFHTRIAQIAKNPLLLQLIEGYALTVGKYKDAMQEDRKTDMKRHIKEHEDILYALETRDREAMQLAVRTHMINTEKDIKRQVDANTAIKFVNRTV